MNDITSIMSKSLCRVICDDATHIRKSIKICKKDNWICCWKCGNNIVYVNYAYMCNICHQHYCISHFIAHKEPVLHIHKSSNITIYDIKSLGNEIIKFDRTFSPWSDTISYEGSIYVFNGSNAYGVYRFALLKKKLISLDARNSERDCSGLCSTRGAIYCIGGNHEGNSLNVCEKYNILAKKWETLPNLNQERCYNAAFHFQHKWIYTVNGHYKVEKLESIERLDIKSNKRWVIIGPVVNELGASKCMNGIQIGKSQVLLFGSNSSEDKSYLMRINSSNITIQPHAVMPAVRRFCWSTVPFVYGSKVYSVDEDKIIFEYDINTEHWRILVNKIE